MAEKELEKRKLESDLLTFTKWHFDQQGERFLVNWHHEKIIEALQRVERGDSKNLLINIPPRYGKTELVVKMWIAQSLARNPKAKFIHLSYSGDLALDNSAMVREIVKSDCFQDYWDLSIKDDADSKAKWYTTDGGGVYATHAAGAITGFGAGLTIPSGGFDGAIIIDDPLKPDDANSDIERTKVNKRLNSTIKSRRNHTDTPIVIVMQRLHEDDMSGFVLGGGMGEEFEHLCLPALQEDNTALWPEKHTVEKLLSMKSHIDSSQVFFTQYQQTPSPPEGKIFKLPWFPRYLQAPDKCELIVHSWDTAYKPKQHNDPSCLTVWKITESGYYLIDCVVNRWEYPDLKRNIQSYASRDNPHYILIEDKASGQSLIQDLQYETVLPIAAIQPVSDKETRARACAGQCEGKNVFLPENAPWLADFENELTMFPNAKHDDRVDSLSQFLNWLRNREAPQDIEKMYEDFYR